MSNSDQNNPESFSSLLLHKLSEELYKAKHVKGKGHRGTAIHFNERINVQKIYEGFRQNYPKHANWAPELMQAKHLLLQAMEPYRASSENEQRRITEVLLQATREIAKK